MKRVVETCSRAPAAHASHAAETGSAKRHAPGGKLLRDDGSHLDFRLRCLKLCGVCGNGSGGSGGVHQPLRETLSSLAKPFQADPTKRETARLCAKIALDLFYLFRFSGWNQLFVVFMMLNCPRCFSTEDVCVNRRVEHTNPEPPPE